MKNYEPFEECYAIVTGRCSTGVFLRLDNNEEAFAYSFNLIPGTKVLCTVRKSATDNRRTLVWIDSVIQYAIA